MNANLQHLQEEIDRLKAELADREAALPAHSVRPHQIMLIESLEEEIERKQKALNVLKRTSDDQLPEDDDG